MEIHIAILTGESVAPALVVHMKMTMALPSSVCRVTSKLWIPLLDSSLLGGPKASNNAEKEKAQKQSCS